MKYCFRLLLLFAFPSLLFAQWIHSNSPHGNTVFSSTTTGSTVVVGTDGGGIYTTTNLGQSWVGLNTGFTGSDILSVAAVPNSSGSLDIFAGTNGDGLVFTTDGGNTWQSPNLGATNVSVLSVSVQNSYVYVGTDGDGFWVSSDLGVTWQAANTGLTSTSILSLAVTSNFLGGVNLFAGTYGGGVFISTNNGTNWHAVNSGLANLYVQSLSVVPNGSGGTKLIAGTYGGGVSISVNNGTSWQTVNTGFVSHSTGYTTISSVTSEVNSSGVVLYAASDVDGIFTSIDNGTTWAKAGYPNPAYTLSIISDSTGNSFVFAGTAGAGVLTLQGNTWTPVNVGITYGNVLSLVANGSTVFAGTDIGTVMPSTNGGGRWLPVSGALNDHAIQSLYYDKANSILYAGTLGSGVFLSSDRGNTWQQASNGIQDSNIYALSVLPGPNNVPTLFAGTGGDGVISTTDKGTTWLELNTGLTYFPVFSFLNIPLPGSSSLMFVGMAAAGGFNPSAGVFVSTNNGQYWKPTSLRGTAGESLAWCDSGIVVGTDFRGVLLSRDSGKTWGTRNNSLPQTFGFYNTVTSLISVDSYLFAGLYDNGIYFSTDDGTTWNGVNSELTDTRINALAYGGGSIYAATPSGIWIRPLSDFGIAGVHDHSNALPKEYSLQQNYPNPFNPSTTIEFALPRSGYASLKIFNLLGQEISTLRSEELPAGTYRTVWNANGLPSGTYFYQLHAGSFIQTKKLVLIR